MESLSDSSSQTDQNSDFEIETVAPNLPTTSKEVEGASNELFRDDKSTTRESNDEFYHLTPVEIGECISNVAENTVTNQIATGIERLIFQQRL
jgi:hypothetical protein